MARVIVTVCCWCRACACNADGRLFHWRPNFLLLLLMTRPKLQPRWVDLIVWYACVGCKEYCQLWTDATPSVRALSRQPLADVASRVQSGLRTCWGAAAVRKRPACLQCHEQGVHATYWCLVASVQSATVLCSCCLCRSISLLYCCSFLFFVGENVFFC